MVPDGASIMFAPSAGQPAAADSHWRRFTGEMSGSWCSHYDGCAVVYVVQQNRTEPIAQLSITGLSVIDKLTRPFLHVDAPQNLTLAQRALRHITIEGAVQAKSDNATKQCNAEGVEASTEWAVNLSLTCSGKAAVSKSALKTADEATFEILL